MLDVGTGSGYHAALLARLARHVYSIEVHASLSRSAAAQPRAAGVENVTLTIGDGVARAARARALRRDQRRRRGRRRASRPRCPRSSRPGGRLVAPVDNGEQRLVVARRTDAGVTLTELERVRFVPLVTR